MEKYIVSGGKRLCGEVVISGAKNAAVAIIPATILIKGTCRIENVPMVSDVSTFMDILYKMGASVKLVNKSTLEINCSTINNSIPPHELVRSLRASCYLMGALLGRFGSASVDYPGGCDFGVRPIDQHIKGFEALGANVSNDKGTVEIKTENGVVGNTVYLDIVSVGATINIILAAACSEGQTVIENAAKEPHIVDLANFLNSMGADIKGAGTDTIKINGVKELKGGSYSIIPDQIEAGSFMMLAAATNGEILIKNIIPKHLESISAKLIEIGAVVEEFDDCILVKGNGKLSKTNVKTQPYPGYPTDMQPQIVVLLSLCDGTSIVTENVWDNRFKYVDELKRMGANIQVDGRVAVIEGVKTLSSANVRATDLRAGVALVIAALTSEGVSEIEEIRHIERGYEDIVTKLRSLGADIKKIMIPEGVMLEKAN